MASTHFANWLSRSKSGLRNAWFESSALALSDDPLSRVSYNLSCWYRMASWCSGDTGILDAARVWLRTFSDRSRSMQGVAERDDGPDEEVSPSVSAASMAEGGLGVCCCCCCCGWESISA